MGLERDGQRARTRVLADVSVLRPDQVEPLQHRRIRLLDCSARHEPDHCHRYDARSCPSPEPVMNIRLSSF
ncbi:hypothetical protein KM043_008769 [Ampulex compressa]|nr:hypothetical protein KM043_008769 [Ampulex compressa]